MPSKGLTHGGSDGHGQVARTEFHAGPVLLGGGPKGASCAAKGAISQLQEFVQGSKLFPLPSNCPVLRWGYDTRMAGVKGFESACLEFRASVAFLLDGIPHHATGSWRLSKKMAQRDAAERTLALFVNRWGQVAMKVLGYSVSYSGGATACKVDVEDAAEGQVEEEEELEETEGDDSSLGPETVVLGEFCSNRMRPAVAGLPAWSHRSDGNQFQAFAEVLIFGVPHTFPGKNSDSQLEAYADAARRALWYLQCPGYEYLFEPDPDFVRAASQCLPDASPSWQRDGLGARGEELQLAAERKTLVMRVQNRLQQVYARQLEAGTSVWYWSYDRQPRDRGWPPLIRATVHVPLAGSTFTGTWTRGQREAQLETCMKIVAYLDEAFPNSKVF